mmetsp:Transcript_18098/g.17469  ORF Transcript_18098/g.17469 Transcript_18098/m.17469 type:complete len:144 (-) Transcript_18098:61-492(-)
MNLIGLPLIVLIVLVMSMSSKAEGFVNPSIKQKSPSSSRNSEMNSQDNETTAGKNEIKALSEADPNDTSIPTLKLGNTISFKNLGPIIINSDGTTMRIDNWDELTEREKEVTWKRISKRNEERKKALFEKQQNEIKEQTQSSE